MYIAAAIGAEPANIDAGAADAGATAFAADDAMVATVNAEFNVAAIYDTLPHAASLTAFCPQFAPKCFLPLPAFAAIFVVAR